MSLRAVCAISIYADSLAAQFTQVFSVAVSARGCAKAEIQKQDSRFHTAQLQAQGSRSAQPFAFNTG
jgi:hypothetical protein